MAKWIRVKSDSVDTDLVRIDQVIGIQVTKSNIYLKLANGNTEKWVGAPNGQAFSEFVSAFDTTDVI